MILGTDVTDYSLTDGSTKCTREHIGFGHRQGQRKREGKGCSIPCEINYGTLNFCSASRLSNRAAVYFEGR